MRPLSIVAVAVAATLGGVAIAQSSSDFYDLGDYNYFDPPTVKCGEQGASGCEGPTMPPPLAKSLASSASQEETASPDAFAASAPTITAPLSDFRAQGKQLAETLRGMASENVTDANAQEVPGYNSGDHLSHYADNPEALETAGSNKASTNDAFLTVKSPQRPRVTLGDDVLRRALEIEADPRSFITDGPEGSNGRCKPLPEKDTGTAYYEATCHEGLSPQSSGRICDIPLVVQPVKEIAYGYFCGVYSYTPSTCTSQFTSALASGQCTEHSRGYYLDLTVIEYRCSSPVAGRGPGAKIEITTDVSEVWDDSACPSSGVGSTCSISQEICTDINPQTRNIDGLDVTRNCWKKQRIYQCSGTTEKSDCAEFNNNPSCKFTKETCLDTPQLGACQVRERNYQCPLPGGSPAELEEYICDGDIYCINGDCEPIKRTPSDEFGDAIVALNALGQAKDEFDENALSLFTGQREQCTKKLFGAINCCSGKGIPLLTPFLCSSQDRSVDEKDDKGLCHKVGTYCSTKVLGICVTTKRAYCCYESKLTRIIQQQGRAQLGKGWGEPKHAQCDGFTVAEFQQLDLSLMNFSEIYADFADAVNLPDEIETTQKIQRRVKNYFSNSASQER